MVEATTDKAAGTGSARGVRRVAMGLLLAVAGTLAVSAWAQHGPGRGGDFGGPGLFMGRPGHVGHAVDRLLKGLDVTDAQRAQIQQIAQAAAIDLKARHAATRGLREQGVQLFTAPVVDARAVEALRQQTLAQHDQASKRVTQALLEISQVLTPDQRKALAERIKQRIQQRAEHRREHRQHQGTASSPGK